MPPASPEPGRAHAADRPGMTGYGWAPRRSRPPRRTCAAGAAADMGGPGPGMPQPAVRLPGPDGGVGCGRGPGRAWRPAGRSGHWRGPTSRRAAMATSTGPQPLRGGGGLTARTAAQLRDRRGWRLASTWRPDPPGARAARRAVRGRGEGSTALAEHHPHGGQGRCRGDIDGDPAPSSPSGSPCSTCWRRPAATGRRPSAPAG